MLHNNYALFDVRMKYKQQQQQQNQHSTVLSSFSGFKCQPLQKKKGVICF